MLESLIFLLEFIMKIKNKCFGCEKRTVGCHSTCEDYLEFRKQKDNENTEIQKSKRDDYRYYELNRNKNS